MKREALCQMTQTVSAGNLSPCTTKRITNKFFLWQEEYCAKVVKAKLSDLVFFLSRKSGKALQVFTTSNILGKFRIHWSAISSERKFALEKLRQNENSDFAAHWRIFPGNGALRRTVCKETLCSDRYVCYVKAKSSNWKVWLCWWSINMLSSKNWQNKENECYNLIF